MIETLYSIGNGTGKIRATRKVERWRVALLSTSEKSLPEMFARSRNTMPERLSVQLLDIPARSWTYGLIETLHGHSDGHTFLMALPQACRPNHGHVLPRFVGMILKSDGNTTSKLPHILAHYRAQMLKAMDLPKSSASGQVHRAIERFARVAAAGEIAIAKGLLPWARNTAATIAANLARLWYDAFVTRQPCVKTGIVSDLRAYLSDNIDHFVDLENDQSTVSGTSLGWKNHDWIYLQRKAFDTNIVGREPIRTVSQRLEGTGILVRGGEARSLQYKMPERLVRARPRVYRFRRAAIAD